MSRWTECRLSKLYSETGKPLSVGDKVLVDFLTHGEIVLIINASSEESVQYDCENTGGVLLRLEPSGLTLLPFGTNTRIDLIETE